MKSTVPGPSLDLFERNASIATQSLAPTAFVIRATQISPLPVAASPMFLARWFFVIGPIPGSSISPSGPSEPIRRLKALNPSPAISRAPETTDRALRVLPKTFKTRPIESILATRSSLNPLNATLNAGHFDSRIETLKPAAYTTHTYSVINALDSSRRYVDGEIPLAQRRSSGCSTRT